MRISDWSSDVCSSDLGTDPRYRDRRHTLWVDRREHGAPNRAKSLGRDESDRRQEPRGPPGAGVHGAGGFSPHPRSEEHTFELQSLMRISYAVFCLKKRYKILSTGRRRKSRSLSTSACSYASSRFTFT